MEKPDCEDEFLPFVQSCEEALVEGQRWLQDGEPKVSAVIERTLKMMMRVKQDLEGDQTPEILRGIITAYLELFEFSGCAEVVHREAAKKVSVSQIVVTVLYIIRKPEGKN